MSDPTCSTCHDTGMTRSGQLDCPFCDAAAERNRFHERLADEKGITGPAWVLDVAWGAYRMGQQPTAEAG
jgi:hypothetical protein